MANNQLIASLVASIPMAGGIGDMWPVFNDPAMFKSVVKALAEPYVDAGITRVAGVEARGFVLGAAVAAELRAGFVGIRKPGGLYPGPSYERRTPPDYRGNEFVLRLQKAALGVGDKAILVDDWFETGGQATAAMELLIESGAEYCGASIVVDWLPEEKRTALAPVHTILDRATLPG